MRRPVGPRGHRFCFGHIYISQNSLAIIRFHIQLVMPPDPTSAGRGISESPSWLFYQVAVVPSANGDFDLLIDGPSSISL